MFRRKGNVPTPSETYLPVGTFRNELFYVTGPWRKEISEYDTPALQRFHVWCTFDCLTLLGKCKTMLQYFPLERSTDERSFQIQRDIRSIFGGLERVNVNGCKVILLVRLMFGELYNWDERN